MSYILEIIPIIMNVNIALIIILPKIFFIISVIFNHLFLLFGLTSLSIKLSKIKIYLNFINFFF